MPPEFVARLQEVCGESLRAVIPFDSFDYQFEYYREDLHGRYSEEEIEKIHREVIAEGISMEKANEVMQVGDQQARITVFQEIIVFAFPSDRYEGVFVSVDRDTEATILDVVDVAKATLPTFDGPPR